MNKRVYSLKPIKWEVGSDYAVGVAPLHSYNIRYSDLERAYITTYTEHVTQESGTRLTSSIESAIEWAEETHIPAKMLEWFDLVNVGERS